MTAPFPIVLKLAEAALHTDNSVYPISLQFSDNEWKGIFTEARRQSVAGLTFAALSSLAEDLVPSPALVAQWSATAARIEASHRRHTATLANIAEALRVNSIKAVVVKGLVVADFYPEPSLRECGDIDLYFPGGDPDRLKAAEIISAGSCVEKMKDGSLLMIVNGIPVELHTTLFDIQRKRNRPLLGQLESEEGFMPLQLGSQAIDGLLTPTLTCHMVLSSLHILRHALSFGIGLRQICDYAVMARKARSDGSLARVSQIMESLGLKKWDSTLMRFIASHLLTEHDKKVDAHTANPLYNIIGNSGNFGLAPASGHHSALSVLNNQRQLAAIAPLQTITTIRQLITRGLQ